MERKGTGDSGDGGDGGGNSKSDRSGKYRGSDSDSGSDEKTVQ